MTKNTTVHHDSSDSRARMPSLIAVLLLLEVWPETPILPKPSFS